METQPVLTIVAGANGSGKTTFARPYTEHNGLQFLNADDLTKAFEDRGEPNAMMKGGREFFKLLNGALARKEDVVIETTLSGTYTTKVSKKAKQLGYQVKMIYIFLDNAEMCVDRVMLRVQKGGHDVPVEDIKRRYYRSIANFRDTFMSFVDVWYLYYNGLDRHQLVAKQTQSTVDVVDQNKFDYLLNIQTDVTD